MENYCNYQFIINPYLLKNNKFSPNDLKIIKSSISIRVLVNLQNLFKELKNKLYIQKLIISKESLVSNPNVQHVNSVSLQVDHIKHQISFILKNLHYLAIKRMYHWFSFIVRMRSIVRRNNKWRIASCDDNVWW